MRETQLVYCTVEIFNEFCSEIDEYNDREEKCSDIYVILNPLWYKFLFQQKPTVNVQVQWSSSGDFMEVWLLHWSRSKPRYSQQLLTIGDNIDKMDYHAADLLRLRGARFGAGNCNGELENQPLCVIEYFVDCWIIYIHIQNQKILDNKET